MAHAMRSANGISMEIMAYYISKLVPNNLPQLQQVTDAHSHLIRSPSYNPGGKYCHRGATQAPTS